MQAADEVTAEAFALKEREKKEAIEAIERQLRPRKRKRKPIRKEDKPGNVPFFSYYLNCLKVGLVILGVIVFLLVMYKIVTVI